MQFQSTTGANIVLPGLTITHSAAVHLPYDNYIADEDRRAKINKLYVDGDVEFVDWDDSDEGGVSVLFPTYTAGELEENEYGEHDFSLKIGLAGTLTVAAGLEHVPLPVGGQLKRAYAAVGTDPTGAAILLDINKNGTTVFTTQANRLTIADGATVGEGDEGDWADADQGAKKFNPGDVVSVDVDQIGTGSSHHGADLAVVLTFTKTTAAEEND